MIGKRFERSDDARSGDRGNGEQGLALRQGVARGRLVGVARGHADSGGAGFRYGKGSKVLRLAQIQTEDELLDHCLRLREQRFRPKLFCRSRLERQRHFDSIAHPPVRHGILIFWTFFCQSPHPSGS